MKKSKAVAKLMDLRDAEFNAPNKDMELLEALCMAIEELAQGDYQIYMSVWHDKEE